MSPSDLEQDVYLIFILEFYVLGSVKYFFVLIAIWSFIYNNKTGYFNRKMMKWSNSFCIKMITCALISINYSCMAILFTIIFEEFSYLFFINSGVWLVNASLLYFEYRRKLPQSWCGLRFHWLFNGVLYFFKVVFLLSFFTQSSIVKFKGLILLYLIQGFFSVVLMYYSIFKPKDYEVTSTSINQFMSLHGFSENSDSFIKNDFGDLNIRESLRHKDNGISNNNLVSVAEVDKNGNIQTLNLPHEQLIFNKYGDTLKSKLLVQNKPLIRIAISEIKSRKFSVKQELIQNINKAKIRFLLKICLPFTSKKNKNVINNERQYCVKKTISDIVSFNNQILEKFQNKINYVSPLKIQLKNINDIINKYSINNLTGAIDIENLNIDSVNYNFSHRLSVANTNTNLYSSSLQSQNNSLASKIKTLETVYVNLCRNFVFFLPEFLKFLEIKDTKLIEKLTNTLENFNSNFNFHDPRLKSIMVAEGPNEYTENLNKSHLSTSQEKIQLNSNLLKKSNSGSEKTSEKKEDFFSEFDTQSKTNNDLIKTMTFINNILYNDRYLRIYIKDLKEKKKLLDSTIVCEISINDAKSGIIINISYKHLLDYCNNTKLKKTQKIKELKNIISEPKNILLLKKEKNSMRKKLSNIFTKLINDLFYFETELFNIFEINKLLNLEISEVDDQIINSFFELDRKSSLNDHLYDSSNHVLKEKNILNFRLFSEFERIEKLETHNNYFFIVLILKIYSINLSKSKTVFQRDSEMLDTSSFQNNEMLWEVEIILVELKNLFIDVIEINYSFHRFYDLNSSLNSIIKIIDTILKNLNTDNLNFSRSKDSSLKILTERISLNSATTSEKKQKANFNVNLLIDDLVIQLNSLFLPPKIYILYSEQFRGLFKIHQLFEKKNSLDGSNMIDFENTCNMVSSSNNSILENLLN